MKPSRCVWVLCAAISAPLFTQQPSAPPQLQAHSPAFNSRIHQLSLNMIVTSSSGLPVTGLQPADFHLFDNRSSTKLAQVQSDPDVEILLILDAINTPHGDLAHAEDQVRALLSRNGGHLVRPLSILLLTDSEPKLKPGTNTAPSVVTALPDRQAFVRRIPASTEGAVLRKALDESVTGLSRISEAQGGEGEAERVRLSLQALNFIATAQLEDPARKILIWISPGWPLLAHSSAHGNQQLFDSIVYFSGLLHDAHITLNAISTAGLTPAVQSPGLPPPQIVNGSTVRGGPSSTPSVDSTPALYQSYFKPSKSAPQADPNDLALQALAYQTGGLVSPPGNAIEAEMAHCLAQADALYVLSFDLPAATGSTQYHDLAVKIGRPGVQIHTLTGYYAR